MNDARRAAQQAYHPATLRLPVSFDYPLRGIAGRAAIGFALVLVSVGCALLLQPGNLRMAGTIFFGLFGGVVTISNLRALIDPAWRKLVLDENGVEVRYGFSRRCYPFLDYSDYRVARIGLRRFLTALPVELDRSLGERARRVRVTLYDRPAFLAPMPMLGGGAPLTLLEWQSTLNELRRAAIAAAGVPAGFEREAKEKRAEETRRAAVWRARERAGASPSRLSRGAYVRARLAVGLAFFVVLLVPLGLSYVRHGIVAVCGLASGTACLGIDAAAQQIVMIGGPVLAILVFVLGNAHLTVRRARDLDEDLSYWEAALDLLSRSSALRRRLSRQEGSSGANRFGPAPPT